MVKDDIIRDFIRDLFGGKCGVEQGGWGINNLDIFYFVCKIQLVRIVENKCCVCIFKYYYSISVQFVIIFKWDFVGKFIYIDDYIEVGGKVGDQVGVKVIIILKGSMGERINKVLYKVEEKK